MVLTHGTKLIRLETQAANPNLSNSKPRVWVLLVRSPPSTTESKLSAHVTGPEGLGRGVPNGSWGLQSWAVVPASLWHWVPQPPRDVGEGQGQGQR